MCIASKLQYVEIDAQVQDLGIFILTTRVINTLIFTVQTQAMLLVGVFFAAELIPIYLTLDKSLLAMLSVENYEPLLESSEIYR